MVGEQFLGKWKLNHSKCENFEEYMKKVGVGLITRKVGGAATPVMTVTCDSEGKWNFHSVSTFKTVDFPFKLDTDYFEHDTPDGRRMKSKMYMEGDKMVQDERKVKDGDHDSMMWRYVEGDELIIDLECEGVKAKRVYDRVKE